MKTTIRKGGDRKAAAAAAKRLEARRWRRHFNRLITLGPALAEDYLIAQRKRDRKRAR